MTSVERGLLAGCLVLGNLLFQAFVWQQELRMLYAKLRGTCRPWLDTHPPIPPHPPTKGDNLSLEMVSRIYGDVPVDDVQFSGEGGFKSR